MQSVRFLVLTAIAAAAAHADFSYITVTKSPSGEVISKHYIKGQKLVTDYPERTTIMDLDAQTMTTINKAQKTYSVRPFSDLYGKTAPSGMNVNADIKKTGQTKNINGFDTEEMVVTVAVDSSQTARPGAKGPPMQMQMEMHMWIASEVPGIEEARAFYQKNADRMPWAAMAGGMSGMAEIQHKLATMHGIPVLTVMKIGSPDPQQQAKMDQMRAQIEAMKKQGGPQAAMADQILGKMGNGSTDTTNESSGFSAKPVSDSVFAIPSGYQKVDK